MSTKASTSRTIPMRDLSNARVAGAPQKRLRDAIDSPSPPAAPQGFVMLNGFPTEVWSNEALSHVDILDAEADKRNPELHDIYVSNDFYAYALYELIEDRLNEFSKLLKKEPASTKTWHALEALTFFIATLDDSAIDGIDDCDRFCAFVRVFAAAWYTLARRRQYAQPASLLISTELPNAANVMMTAAKILQFWCETADIEELEEIREVPTLLAVMLRQDGWNVKPKTSRILGEYGESPDDVDEPPRKRSKTNGRNSTRIENLAGMTLRQITKVLDVNEKALNFETEWLAYNKRHAGAGVPLFEVGNEWASGFDITKWPAEVRAKHSLARQLDIDLRDLPDFVPRDARQFQSLRN
ncbi:hypothetical protein BKA62DRAFT_753192 [Auriculariales sp. MPI-PUGE-AT-0066]|nr:hypothetical protein BKA62DRAFT_753192 [Auriculariales sp. MPI-PUGE-AT-0066]